MAFICNPKYREDMLKVDAKQFTLDEEKKKDTVLQKCDQFDAQPFMRGDNGFNRNIISIIMSTENADLQQSLLNRLSELEKTEGYDPNTSVGDIISQIVPRNAQTFASQIEWLSNLKSIGDFVENLRNLAKPKEQTIESASTGAPDEFASTGAPENNS